MLYNRTEHRRRFFIYSMIKNRIISTRIRLNFQSKLYFPNEEMWRQQCTLKKHAKINQSQSLLELFKLFDWRRNRQQSITNWTSAKLSASSSLERLSREEGCLQRVQSSLFSSFKYGSKGRWKLIHSPEDSSCIVALENVNFCSGNYEARSS